MNRRTFLKQSAVVVAGMATGVTVAIASSGFPGVMGVDVAKPGSDSTIIYLGYSNKLETHIWKSPFPEDLYIRMIASAFAVPVELLT